MSDVRAAILVALGVAVLAAGADARRGGDIAVPGDAATVQQAIARAQPGDRIVLAAGTYPGGYVVPAGKHDITIAGADRNAVVLDGEDTRDNGIIVRADGVSLLNMTAHNFVDNAFYWQGADRFRASYLTAWNVLGYGIYVEDGRNGVVDNDYVSGAADAAYYVGECKPCDATIANVVATRSAVGYSGTNASGVVIRDSTWTGNGAGILPNTYANEGVPPQAGNVITGNTVTSSGRARVPIHTPLSGFFGIGIAIAGGNKNTIRDNHVTGSERYGIAVFSTARFITFNPTVPEPRPRWRARGNRVVENVVSGSGRADLALAVGAGPNNCFTGNTVGRTVPARLQTASCARTGDRRVSVALEGRVQRMVADTLRRRRPPSYTSLPAPPPQPNMP